MRSADQNAYGRNPYRESALRLAVHHLVCATMARRIDRDPVAVAFHLARAAEARVLAGGTR